MAPTPVSPTVLTHTAALEWDPEAWVDGDDAEGNLVPNSDGRTFVGLYNSSVSAQTVSARVTRTVDGLSLASDARQYSLAAGELRVVKLGPIGDYGSQVLLTPSDSDVKIAAFQL